MNLQEFKQKYPFCQKLEKSEIQEMLMFMVTCLMDINLKGSGEKSRLEIFSLAVRELE